MVGRVLLIAVLGFAALALAGCVSGVPQEDTPVPIRELPPSTPQPPFDVPSLYWSFSGYGTEYAGDQLFNIWHYKHEGKDRDVTALIETVAQPIKDADWDLVDTDQQGTSIIYAYTRGDEYMMVNLREDQAGVDRLWMSIWLPAEEQ